MLAPRQPMVARARRPSPAAVTRTRAPGAGVAGLQRIRAPEAVASSLICVAPLAVVTRKRVTTRRPAPRPRMASRIVPRDPGTVTVARKPPRGLARSRARVRRPAPTVTGSPALNPPPTSATRLPAGPAAGRSSTRGVAAAMAGTASAATSGPTMPIARRLTPEGRSIPFHRRDRRRAAV